MDTVSYLLGKNASGGGSSLQSKEVEITTNTTTNITPDAGYNGLSSVKVITDVPSKDIVEKDVNLYDYDGTLLFSYTKDEFASLSSYPTPPAKELLTFQEWNWSLADAKQYVAKYGGQCIGATYTTKDGNTKIHIGLDSFNGETLEDISLNFYLNVNGSGSGELTINWGDGTSSETSTEYSGSLITKTHSYLNKGDYIISVGFTPLSGQAKLMFDNGTTTEFITNRGRTVKEVNFGSNIILYSGSEFYNCINLKKVSLPSGIFGTYESGNLSNVFRGCHILKCVILPSGAKYCNGNMFLDCNSMEILSIPKSFLTFGTGGTSSQSTLQFDSVLKYLYLPETFTGGLTQLLNNRPYGYQVICVPTPATDFLLPTLGAQYGTFNLRKLVVPTGLTTFPYMFGAVIQHLDIPDNITALSSFGYWNTLRSVKMSKNVASITSNIFASSKVRYLYFTDNVSVPELGGNWTNGNCAYMVFIVPDALYNTWIATEGWADISDRIIRESDFNN